MATVRKALPEDFEKIYPLLCKLNDTRLKQDDWKQLFGDHWNCQEGYHGYILTDKTRVLGFIGLIFSKRAIDGTLQKFCNITSGIVNKINRNESLKIFLPLLSLKDYTITDLTPSVEVSAILKRFGFKILEDSCFIIFPNLFPIPNDCSIIFDKETISRYLVQEEKRALNDHIYFKCIHLLLKIRDKHCYLILNKTFKKNIAFARINFIGNPDLFSCYIGRACAKICFKLKVCGLLVDQRLLKGREIKKAWKKKMKKEALFKSDCLSKEAIDNLYSEFIVLNI